MLGIIVPVVPGRLENLKLLVSSLEQNDDTGIAVMAVVDGTTDHRYKDELSEWLWNYYGKYEIEVLFGGPAKGFRGGRARNIAAFNIGYQCGPVSHYWFVDSDVVLHKDAVASMKRAIEAQPNAIVVGQCDWLLPYKWNDENKHILWESRTYEELLEKASGISTYPIDNPENIGLIGPDLRIKDFSDDLNALRKGCGLGAFSTNICYPAELFWKVGGFDERIIGHGGEDADLGLTVDELDVDWLFYKPVRGFHIWHTRNQRNNVREVQANIAFIDAKHGVGQYKNARKWIDAQDWNDPIHYHKHLGSIIVKKGFEPTMYVSRENNVLGLPSPDWLFKLGFANDDIQIVDDSWFEGKNVIGRAFQMLDDRPEMLVGLYFQPVILQPPAVVRILACELELLVELTYLIERSPIPSKYGALKKWNVAPRQPIQPDQSDVLLAERPSELLPPAFTVKHEIIVADEYRIAGGDAEPKVPRLRQADVLLKLGELRQDDWIALETLLPKPPRDALPRVLCRRSAIVDVYQLELFADRSVHRLETLLCDRPHALRNNDYTKHFYLS